MVKITPNFSLRDIPPYTRLNPDTHFILSQMIWIKKIIAEGKKIPPPGEETYFVRAL